jgi:quinone-modifying oxidoreductase subunit QmoB
MDRKLGVYICSGCAIGESVDTEKLAQIAKREGKAAACRIHPFLCSSEGAGMIRKDLTENGINAVVIAACSPRMKTESFAFDPRMILDRVNLREHVAWCHDPRDEDTQMLAEDYLRMGIARAQKMEPLEPVSDQVSTRLLVVGGGITGMTAALEAAAGGYQVTLIEKQAELGGFAATLKKRFPSKPPYTEPITEATVQLAGLILYHPQIQVHTSARILKIEGQPGMFDVTVEAGLTTSTFRAGAVIMATGWRPYDAGKLGHLGYGRIQDVITNVELEKMAARGPVLRPSDRRSPGSVLFIQCAGSRDKDHLPYCSSVCCMNSLKQAVYIREQNPNAKVFIVYKDIRTPGQYERFYRKVQDEPLNFFTKGEVV